MGCQLCCTSGVAVCHCAHAMNPKGRPLYELNFRVSEEEEEQEDMTTEADEKSNSKDESLQIQNIINYLEYERVD